MSGSILNGGSMLNKMFETLEQELGSQLVPGKLTFCPPKSFTLRKDLHRDGTSTITLSATLTVQMSEDSEG